jgi:hypothetical protein
MKPHLKRAVEKVEKFHHLRHLHHQQAVVINNQIVITLEE